MTKQELLKTKDNELIAESINTYARLLVNDRCRMGTKLLEKHWKDCTDELLKRNLLTQSDVDWLNR